MVITNKVAIARLGEIRDLLYRAQSKKKRSREFKAQRASEQAVTEIHWEEQMVALKMAIALLESDDFKNSLWPEGKPTPP